MSENDLLRDWLFAARAMRKAEEAFAESLAAFLRGETSEAEVRRAQVELHAHRDLVDAVVERLLAAPPPSAARH